MQPLRAHAIVLCFGLTATLLAAQSSPFMAAANRSAKAAAAPSEPSKFEFTGVVNLGAESLICITLTDQQRSHWLKLGQSAGGITLVSHDPASKSTIIRHAGRETQLVLKERETSFDPGNLVVYQPSGPLPSAGLAEHVPLTNQEKATEARMLVSDLLEIGMIQRKAYEEAKEQEVAEKREAKKSP